MSDKQDTKAYIVGATEMSDEEHIVVGPQWPGSRVTWSIISAAGNVGLDETAGMLRLLTAEPFGSDMGLEPVRDFLRRILKDAAE